jgi:hypothetical protein
VTQLPARHSEAWSSSPAPAVEARRRGRTRAALHAANGLLGGLLGLLPHVLHHIAFLAGTAVVAGSGGTALFAALGLLGSIPLLLRLYHRFHSWRAPALGLTVFLAMFAVSAFVIGPAISGTSAGAGPTPTVTDHSNHH